MSAEPLSPATLSDGPVRVSLAPPCARLSLRARGDLVPLDGALGLSLPERTGKRAAAGAVEVIRLGPDEWILHAPEAELPRLIDACAKVYAAHPHSLVDISGREVTYVIEGPAAAELLTIGCPRDPDSIAAGEGRRTVFDGVSVILWRDSATRFRLDCWQSFAPHVHSLLETGCRELAAEAS